MIVKSLLTVEQLREGVVRMARDITTVYGTQSLTIVGVMTGSVVLLADLIRLLEMPLRVGVLQASSYRGETSRGELNINATMMLDITNRDVLLVDDIFDTGHTLAVTVATLQKLSPTSLRTCVLLRKRGRQEVDMKPDFVGFDIPDEFVVGYGLDYRDHYRNLPYLAVLTQSDLGLGSLGRFEVRSSKPEAPAKEPTQRYALGPSLALQASMKGRCTHANQGYSGPSADRWDRRWRLAGRSRAGR
jgi:hypoxanthine phosphoribosyltransferase